MVKPCPRCGADCASLVPVIPRGPINQVTPKITEIQRPQPQSSTERMFWVRPTYAAPRIAKVIKLPSAWEWEEFYNVFPSVDS